jgi:type I restriction enzyme M protein
MDARAATAVKPALEMGRQEHRHAPKPSVKLTQQQLEAHLWDAANILRGKTAGQDYKNYILSLMFYKRLCNQWENEADEAIAELERQQSRTFTDAQKAVFRARGEHRYSIPEGSRWGDVLAASTNLGETLTQARAVSSVKPLIGRKPRNLASSLN